MNKTFWSLSRKTREEKIESGKCIVYGCKGKHAKGSSEYCSRHYVVPTVYKAPAVSCISEDCGFAIFQRDMCHQHFHEWRASSESRCALGGCKNIKKVGSDICVRHIKELSVSSTK